MQVTFKQWSNELDVLERVKVIEERVSVYYKIRDPKIISYHDLFLEDCPTQSAQALREKLWGISLTGVTSAPIQHQGRLLPWDTIPTEWIPRSILFTVSPDLVTQGLWTRGDHIPYIGL